MCPPAEPHVPRLTLGVQRWTWAHGITAYMAHPNGNIIWQLVMTLRTSMAFYCSFRVKWEILWFLWGNTEAGVKYILNSEVPKVRPWISEAKVRGHCQYEQWDFALTWLKVRVRSLYPHLYNLALPLTLKYLCQGKDKVSLWFEAHGTYLCKFQWVSLNRSHFCQLVVFSTPVLIVAALYCMYVIMYVFS